MKNIIILLVLFGAFLHFKNQEKPSEEPVAKPETKRYISPYANMPSVNTPTPSVNSVSKSESSSYSCDGRQHCSNMTSCAEAKYFLRNCPNTKMDGDGDGIPCEDQWCSF